MSDSATAVADPRPNVQHSEELALAQACARREPAAIARFEASYFTDLEAVCRRFPALPLTLDDVKQRMREKLFLSNPPAVGSYAGQGDLGGWVRAATLNLLLNVTTREAREAPTERQFFEAVVDAAPSAEAQFLKQSCRQEFEHAFAAAMTQLTARERSLLRYAYADGLGVDEIAPVFAVHRATAARWVARARVRLVTLTRVELMTRLGVDERDAESIVRVALSRIGTTLLRRLG